MNFTSPIFFLFLPIVVILYYKLNKKGRLYLLLIASYLFYAYYSPSLLILILITTLTSYYCGKKKKPFLAIFINLGILFIFKYLNFTIISLLEGWNFFAKTILGSDFLGKNFSFSGFQILLPMGISFYTFQTISYLIDVYKNKFPAEEHLGYYALYVVFFPQLVAGPIEQPKDLIPSLIKSKTPSSLDFEEGFRLFVRGYGKKILIADILAIYVDQAYNHISTISGSTLLFATILFAFQIYCDFSGYSDIALGCGRFLGIQLTENFRNPYKAISIADFWKRWHISLTRFFTNYLYIPLGGKRAGKFKHYRNIFLTFLASGLWHGANITFCIWGSLHGVFMIIETIFSQKSMDKTLISHRFWIAIRRFFTFSLVCFAWIFFRAPTVLDAILIIKAIFTDFNLSTLFIDLHLVPFELFIILFLLCLLPIIEALPILHFYKKRKDSFINIKLQLHTTLLYFILFITLIIARCLILIEKGTSSFIYFQF